MIANQSEGGCPELGGPVPQPPWDLTQSCHPMSHPKTKPGTSDAHPRHGLAPVVGARVASLRGPILRSGPDQCKRKKKYRTRNVDPIENACRITGWQGITYLVLE